MFILQDGKWIQDFHINWWNGWQCSKDKATSLYCSGRCGLFHCLTWQNPQYGIIVKLSSLLLLLLLLLLFYYYLLNVDRGYHFVISILSHYCILFFLFLCFVPVYFKSVTCIPPFNCLYLYLYSLTFSFNICFRMFVILTWKKCPKTMRLYAKAFMQVDVESIPWASKNLVP